MKTRLIHEVGTLATLRVYWGGGGDLDPANDICPSCLGGGNPGYHNAELPLAQSDVLGDWDLGGEPEDFGGECWPTRCDHCGKAVPKDLPVSPPSPTWIDLPEGPVPFRHLSVVHHQVFRQRRYDTASGRPEPGDIYASRWQHQGKHVFCQWTNCDGRHLYCILPDGWEWEMTGRASNCTMKDDQTHRCWVVHELSPGVFHVDKAGHTCNAGAGSIQAPGPKGWHGFLRRGELVLA